MIWKRGIKVIDRDQIANQLLLKWEIILDYRGELKVVTKILKSGSGNYKKEQRDGIMRKTQFHVVGFENRGRGSQYVEASRC